MVPNLANIAKNLFSKKFADFIWQHFLMPKNLPFLKHQLWLLNNKIYQITYQNFRKNSSDDVFEYDLLLEELL